MAPKRKLIGFDPETWQALELLSRDSGKDLQELADEAFADLLAKHHRPRTLKDAPYLQVAFGSRGWLFHKFLTAAASANATAY
jgi:hypothetical protein